MALLKIHPARLSGEDKPKSTPEEETKEIIQRTDYDVRLTSVLGMSADSRAAKVYRCDLVQNANDVPGAAQSRRGYNPCKGRAFSDPKLPAELEKAYGLTNDIWEDFRNQSTQRVNQLSYILWGYLAICIGLHGVIAGVMGNDWLTENGLQLPLYFLMTVGAALAYRVHVSMKKEALKQISVRTLGKVGLNAEYIMVWRKPRYGGWILWLEIYAAGGTAGMETVVNTQVKAEKEPDSQRAEEIKPLIDRTIIPPPQTEPPKSSGFGFIQFCTSCSRKRS